MSRYRSVLPRICPSQCLVMHNLLAPRWNVSLDRTANRVVLNLNFKAGLSLIRKMKIGPQARRPTPKSLRSSVVLTGRSYTYPQACQGRARCRGRGELLICLTGYHVSQGSQTDSSHQSQDFARGEDW